jgi:hypothetical protein
MIASGQENREEAGYSRPRWRERSLELSFSWKRIIVLSSFVPLVPARSSTTQLLNSQLGTNWNKKMAQDNMPHEKRQDTECGLTRWRYKIRCRHKENKTRWSKRQVHVTRAQEGTGEPFIFKVDATTVRVSTTAITSVAHGLLEKVDYLPPASPNPPYVKQTAAFTPVKQTAAMARTTKLQTPRALAH